MAPSHGICFGSKPARPAPSGFIFMPVVTLDGQQCAVNGKIYRDW
jgi:hypothetical protein